MAFLRNIVRAVGFACLWIVFQRTSSVLQLIPQASQIISWEPAILFSVAALVSTGAIVKSAARFCDYGIRQKAVAIATALLPLVFLTCGQSTGNPNPTVFQLAACYLVFGASIVVIAYAWVLEFARLNFDKSIVFTGATVFGAMLLSRLAIISLDALSLNASSWLFLLLVASGLGWLIASLPYQYDLTDTVSVRSVKDRRSLRVALLLLACLLVANVPTTLFWPTEGTGYSNVTRDIATSLFYLAAFASLTASYRGKLSGTQTRMAWWVLLGAIIGLFAGVILGGSGFSEANALNLKVTAWTLAWSFLFFILLLFSYESSVRLTGLFALFFLVPWLIAFLVRYSTLIVDLSAVNLGPTATTAFSLLQIALLVVAFAVMMTAFQSSALFSTLIQESERSQSVDKGETGSQTASRLSALASEYGLTRREVEVMELLALGYNANSVGSRLFISGDTVRSHTKRIYAKTGIHSKQELIALVNDDAA